MNEKEVLPRQEQETHKLSINNNAFLGNKDIGYFLFGFEYHFDTIVKSMKNLNIILILNSIILILCYASVDTFYITKDYSYVGSKGKVVYLG